MLLSGIVCEWRCLWREVVCVTPSDIHVIERSLLSKFNDGHHDSEVRSHCARPNQRKFQAAKLKLRVSLQGTLLPLSDFFFPPLPLLSFFCVRVCILCQKAISGPLSARRTTRDGGSPSSVIQRILAKAGLVLGRFSSRE